MKRIEPDRERRLVARTSWDRGLRIALLVLFGLLIGALLYSFVPLFAMFRERGLSFRQYFYLPLVILLAVAFVARRAFAAFRGFRRR